MVDGKVDFAVGRLIEFTEKERRQIVELAEQLRQKTYKPSPGVAQVILKLFKIVQGAIARSHAS